MVEASVWRLASKGGSKVNCEVITSVDAGMDIMCWTVCSQQWKDLGYEKEVEKILKIFREEIE